MVTGGSFSRPRRSQERRNPRRIARVYQYVFCIDIRGVAMLENDGNALQWIPMP